MRCLIRKARGKNSVFKSYLLVSSKLVLDDAPNEWSAVPNKKKKQNKKQSITCTQPI